MTDSGISEDEQAEYDFFHRREINRSLIGIQCNNPQDLDLDEEARKLSSYIQVVDHKKINLFFGNLENYFYVSGKPAQDIRLDCMILMLEVRSDLVKKFTALKEIFKTRRDTFNTILKGRYLDVIINSMAGTCLHICETLPLLSADSNFQRIISYVNNNYNENLKLENLAQLFYYNSAYLGKNFKKFTGRNFNTYLDMLRINNAKELLQNTEMKVYEISNAVGYLNTDYFYSKFKKYTGKCPLAFRKNVENSDFS